MSELTLYTNPQSRGRIARWMLEETGADYDTQVLTYGGTMKSDGYLAINPMGKVPAIVHNGNVITECAAICAYLADAFPKAGLAPSVSDRAAYYRWLFLAAGPLESALVNRQLGFEVAPEKERMIGYGTFSAMMNLFDKQLCQHAYIAGEAFTAADVYIGAQIIWGLQFGTIETRASFVRYAEQLSTRPAFERANKLDDEAAKKLG